MSQNAASVAAERRTWVRVRIPNARLARQVADRGVELGLEVERTRSWRTRRVVLKASGPASAVTELITDVTAEPPRP